MCYHLGMKLRPLTIRDRGSHSSSSTPFKLLHSDDQKQGEMQSVFAHYSALSCDFHIHTAPSEKVRTLLLGVREPAK